MTATEIVAGVNVHADILFLVHNGAPFGRWWCGQSQLTVKWAPFYIACSQVRHPSGLTTAIVVRAVLAGENDFFSKGIFLLSFQLYPVKGTTNEQDYFMANESTDRRSKIHPASETYGRRSVFLGRAVEICLCEPGSWPFHKARNPVATLHGDIIGCLEIVGGLLLLAGLTTRLIAIPFVAEMIVAILSTKISLYLGTSPLPLPPTPPQVGFWAVLHEVRSEYAQMLTVMFLLVNGPGRWSLDAMLSKRRKAGGVSELVASGRPLDLAGATSR